MLYWAIAGDSDADYLSIAFMKGIWGHLSSPVDFFADKSRLTGARDVDIVSLCVSRQDSSTDMHRDVIDVI